MLSTRSGQHCLIKSRLPCSNIYTIVSFIVGNLIHKTPVAKCNNEYGELIANSCHIILNFILWTIRLLGKIYQCGRCVPTRIECRGAQRRLSTLRNVLATALSGSFDPTLEAISVDREPPVCVPLAYSTLYNLTVVLTNQPS